MGCPSNKFASGKALTSEGLALILSKTRNTNHCLSSVLKNVWSFSEPSKY